MARWPEVGLAQLPGLLQTATVPLKSTVGTLWNWAGRILGHVLLVEDRNVPQSGHETLTE